MTLRREVRTYCSAIAQEQAAIREEGEVCHLHQACKAWKLRRSGMYQQLLIENASLLPKLGAGAGEASNCCWQLIGPKNSASELLELQSKSVHEDCH